MHSQPADRTRGSPATGRPATDSAASTQPNTCKSRGGGGHSQHPHPAPRHAHRSNCCRPTLQKLQKQPQQKQTRELTQSLAATKTDGYTPCLRAGTPSHNSVQQEGLHGSHAPCTSLQPDPGAHTAPASSYSGLTATLPACMRPRQHSQVPHAGEHGSHAPCTSLKNTQFLALQRSPPPAPQPSSAEGGDYTT